MGRMRLREYVGDKYTEAVLRCCWEKIEFSLNYSDSQVFEPSVKRKVGYWNLRKTEDGVETLEY